MTLEGHVGKHDSYILRSDVSIPIKIVHVEGKAHLFTEISDKDICKVLNEGLHSDVFMLLLFGHAFF